VPLIFLGIRHPPQLSGMRLPTPDPDYRRYVIEKWKPFREKAKNSGQTVNTGEYQVTCRDGSVRICELWAKFLPDALIVTFNDINSREQDEDRYRKTIEISLDGFWMADAGGRLIDVNHAYCRMSGYSRDELLQMSIMDPEIGMAPADIERHIISITHNGSDRFESLQRRKNGTHFDVEVSATYTSERAGCFLSLSVILFFTVTSRHNQVSTNIAIKRLRLWIKSRQFRTFSWKIIWV